MHADARTHRRTSSRGFDDYLATPSPRRFVDDDPDTSVEPVHESHQLQAQISAVFSQHENLRRREHIRRGDREPPSAVRVTNAEFTESSLDDADLKDLVTLAADVPSLFHAPTTTNRDRKEIVRILVQRMTIVERTPEYVVATVRWHDGVDDTVLRIFWVPHARPATDCGVGRCWGGFAQGDPRPPRGATIS